MTSFIKFLLGLREPQQRAQALAFERGRQVAPAVRRSLDDVVRALDCGDTVSVFELPDRRVNISRKLLFRHAALLGTTGGGKTMAAMSLLIAALDQALDASVLSGKPLGIEITVIDIKDDIHKFKQRIAAIYRAASAAKRDVMRPFTSSNGRTAESRYSRSSSRALVCRLSTSQNTRPTSSCRRAPPTGRTHSGSCSSRSSDCSCTMTSGSTGQR